jgi:hypothetical protein
MFSREETQKLKREFWIAFAEKYPRKWLLYDTKIKDFAFKFFVDNKKAQVMVAIEPRNIEKRHAYFDKLLSLKTILEQEFVAGLVYEKELFLENGKAISQVWVEIGNVTVSNRNSWDKIFDFFNEKMMAFELFFEEYGDIIRDI